MMVGNEGLHSSPLLVFASVESFLLPRGLCLLGSENSPQESLLPLGLLHITQPLMPVVLEQRECCLLD